MEIVNKKASYEYFIDDSLECGISLWGSEVKSIRDGRCNIKEAWCRIQNGNLVVRGMHISKWGTANAFDVDEDRERQLLAHKKEIKKLESLVQQKGVALVPLKLYFKDGKCKLLIGICRGKHVYDKRASLKEKQVNRDIARSLKG